MLSQLKPHRFIRAAKARAGRPKSISTPKPPASRTLALPELPLANTCNCIDMNLVPLPGISLDLPYNYTVHAQARRRAKRAGGVKRGFAGERSEPAGSNAGSQASEA